MNNEAQIKECYAATTSYPDFAKRLDVIGMEKISSLNFKLKDLPN